MKQVLCAVALLLTSPVVAQTSVSGFNIKAAVFPYGKYEQQDATTWVQYDALGVKRHSFVEQVRDENAVYLFDETRGMRVKIDLARKAIFQADAGQIYSIDTWEITRASAG